MSTSLLDPGEAAVPTARDLCSEGLAFHQAGDLDAARARYAAAIKLDPNHFNALCLLAVISADSGAAQEAVDLIGRAIAAGAGTPGLNAGLAAAHNNLANALAQLERMDEAAAAHDEAIRLHPSVALYLFNRGTTLVKMGRFEAGLADFEAAIALEPVYFEAHCGRGAALCRLDRPAEAVRAYDEALALNPGDAAAQFSRATALQGIDRREEAVAGFETAIALDPDFADAKFCLASLRLCEGDFERGWPLYESRRDKPGYANYRLDPATFWRGDRPLFGKRLFVHCEQGAGDTIQFIRYLPLLKSTGAIRTVAVQRSLVSLLGQVDPACRIIAEGLAPQQFDYHCPLLSLPLIFGTTLRTIPPMPRPLAPDAAGKAKFARLLGPRTRPRIGLVWSGNPEHDDDHNRSIAFARLAPLFSDREDWIAIQKDIRETDRAAVEATPGLALYGDELADFADTAALISHLDLVITVDTSVAHLAGAMARPVWVLIPFDPDWRWLQGRDDSPWYPSARLFRQRATNDWEEVIGRVRRELDRLA